MRLHSSIVALVLAGCGAAGSLGLDEPVRLTNGTFRFGELPGHAPETDGTGPRITAIETSSTVLRRGEADRVITGRASTEAHAIGVRLAGVGAGHWILPVEGADPNANGELTWGIHFDVAHDAPLGNQKLRFVATDEQENGGVQRDLGVCVVPEIPDNLNACDPTRKPPALVVSLTWDSDADLDLVVQTPAGKTVDAKHPTTALQEDGKVQPDALADPTTGRFERDASAGCVRDARRRENLVFTETPPAGTYLLYAQPFAACGAAGANFHLSVHRRVERPDGTWALEEVVSRDGAFVALQANGSRSTPLYVTSYQSP